MSNEYRDNLRCSPPPMRWPRAELVVAIMLALWCTGFGLWLAFGLQGLR